jgi:hypothetical protein
VDSNVSNSAGAGEKGGGMAFFGALAEGLEGFTARCLDLGGILVGYESDTVFGASDRGIGTRLEVCGL